MDDTFPQPADEFGSAWGLRTGYEHWFGCMALRGGYRYWSSGYTWESEPVDSALSGDSDYNAITAGVGLMLGCHCRLDYGMEYRIVGYDDFTHTISMLYSF